MKKKNKRSGKGLSGLVIFGFLALWQGIAMLIGAAYILPTPIQVLQKLWELREPLFLVHLPAIEWRHRTGALISLVLGILLAVFMDMNPTAEKALYPLIVASQTIPTMAIAPLFVLWFGYGIWSKVLAAILITFFPVTITIHDGLRSTKREMEEYMETCGAGRMGNFLEVEGALGNSFVFLRSPDGGSDQRDRRGDRGMAGGPERSWLFQQTDDDPAGRRRGICAHRPALGGGHAGGPFSWENWKNIL